MQHRVIELVHENHLGIAKTIALLGEKIYFVNIEAKLKAKISESILICRCTKRSNISNVRTLNSSTISIEHRRP